MKKILAHALTGLILLAATPAWSDDKSKDQDRLKNCGTVLKEILDIPDDVLQNFRHGSAVLHILHTHSALLAHLSRRCGERGLRRSPRLRQPRVLAPDSAVPIPQGLPSWRGRRGRGDNRLQRAFCLP